MIVEHQSPEEKLETATEMIRFLLRRWKDIHPNDEWYRSEIRQFLEENE